LIFINNDNKFNDINFIYMILLIFKNRHNKLLLKLMLKLHKVVLLQLLLKKLFKLNKIRQRQNQQLQYNLLKLIQLEINLYLKQENN
jgi:hypothetical protein